MHGERFEQPGAGREVISQMALAHPRRAGDLGLRDFHETVLGHQAEGGIQDSLPYVC